MIRLRAAAIHFAIGVVLSAALFALVRYLWYPGALFDVSGAYGPLAWAAAALAIAGPAATFAVYVPGKRGLAFDLVAIALLQATAAGYVAWTLFESRPVYIVFVKDRFELVNAGDFPPSEIARAQGSPFLDLPVAGPRLTGAKLPRDRAEIERLMFELAPYGVDVHHLPQHYVDYSEVAPDAKARAEKLERLRSLNPDRKAEIDGLLAASGLTEDTLGFLPMRAGKRDLAVIIDRRDGKVLRMVALRPWDY